MSITIIVPCYNEEKTIPAFYERINELKGEFGMEHEIIFVDDGSSNSTLEVLKELQKKDSRVEYISFSRNFGKEAAMYAGLCNSTGDYVVIMDADLQDPPELLPRMIEILESGGYDSVATRRVDRKGEPPIRSFFSRAFYSLINKISDTEIVDGARDYRMMTREMVDAVVSLGEYNRFSKGIFGWVGFKTKWISFENRERSAGETKWSFWKLFRYALDGIISFSQAPLSIASWMGSIMTLISFLAIIVIVLRRLIFGDPVAGWASTICIVVFIGGVQLLILGIMGQYIAKTYLETKKRPHYIISDSSIRDVQKTG